MKLTASVILLLSVLIKQFSCLCVLESDFGFAINCNFKKAGMFRVRNLGGLKAHFGLGFSLGDELGFPESLGNVEGSKKRSLDVRTMGGNAIATNNFNTQPVPEKHQFAPRRFETKISPQNFDSIPQGFTKKKPVMMTEALPLPLGVPRFKKLPHKLPQVPKFQSLPSSTSQKFESLTKVEISPDIDDESLQIDLKGHTVEELALMANVSVDVINTAINVRKQQMKNEMKVKASTNALFQDNKVVPSSSTTIQTTQPWISTSATSPATTTTDMTTQSSTTTLKTTHAPKKKIIKKHPLHNGHKVMNAPKEYYPIGYEKDFDDNFKSKVDLPATSFHCGDQKHFPGLYADQDLGCMVFHVCAITDEGLVMKSFLCPENTLFDQTILKCNWWFYTDCKSSKTLYDSNLPMSKSYQLMKSLSFFNKNYKVHVNEKELETQASEQKEIVKEPETLPHSIVIE